jgi:hypothetical protein
MKVLDREDRIATWSVETDWLLPGRHEGIGVLLNSFKLIHVVNDAVWSWHETCRFL